ncbi:MAG TPA: ABC transporter ATP-binding protein [Actinomycetota bacterium]
MLKVSGLACAHGLAAVLSDVSIEVPDATVVALLGRNGMGKTSLCRCVMGLEPPRVTAGQIDLDGTKLSGLPPYARAKLGIGYVPQGRRVFPSLDVVENLTMAARPAPSGAGGGGGDGIEAWTLDRVWAMFPRLADRKHHPAGQLSGGEQQMLAIARALMTNPHLLVMDEPSEGLAPVIVESLGEHLQALRASSLSILLVEQNYTLAMTLADTVYVLENGRIVFHGPPATLDAADDVKRRHLGVGV